MKNKSMKKKIISMALTTVLAVSSTHVVADNVNEDATENDFNYTAVGVGATTGGLILGPIGILIGGVMGSFYDAGDSEDTQLSAVHSMEQNLELNSDQGIDLDIDQRIEATTDVAIDSDTLADASEEKVSEGLLVASSNDDMLFIDEELQSSENTHNRIKEIITNDLSVTVYFKPGSVNYENFYSEQFSTVLNLLNEMPEMELNLDGYSDRQGTVIDNLQLSTERLGSIRDYFVTNGIDENRINLHAYGEKDFLSTPGELESYMYDRRVVVSFKAPAQIPKGNVAIIDPASR